MSKKHRKKKARRPNLPPNTLGVADQVKVEKTRRPLQRTQEFDPDYGYVITDLKRIGVLAGTFIVLLIVLSIFLR